MHKKQQVIDAMRAHPDWCDVEIAQSVPCHSAYVRSIANVMGVTLASRTGRSIDHEGNEWPYPCKRTMAVERQMARVSRALHTLLP